MHKIDIGDAELAVWRDGQADSGGDPVFLVSGLGGRAAFWSELVPPLAQHFDVITHDHRGTGASTKSIITYSVAQMAADVLSLMDALEISRTAIVGHSTGGAIAQYLALHHPDRLTRMVLSATWAGPSPYFQALFDLRRQVLQDSGPEAYLMDGILRAYPPDTLSRTPDLLTGTREERLAAFPGLDIELSRIAAVLAHDLRDQVSRITLPTLVIAAADDQITPVGFSHELAEKIPGAKKVILSHGGHFMPRVATADYNKAILSFLTQPAAEA
jgi:aminoacrylate hydrolase